MRGVCVCLCLCVIATIPNRMPFICWAIVWLALDRRYLVNWSLQKMAVPTIRIRCRLANRSQSKNMCSNLRCRGQNFEIDCLRRCPIPMQTTPIWCFPCCRWSAPTTPISNASFFVRCSILAPIYRFSSLYHQSSPIFSPCKKRMTRIRQFINEKSPPHR